MHVGIFVAIVATLSQAIAQQGCGPIDIVFAVDTSENAKAGSTLNNDLYYYLKEALRSFATNQRIQQANVRIGAVGYSSGSVMMTSLQPPNAALQNLNSFFSNNNNFIIGGSFTNRGLSFFNNNNAFGQPLNGRSNIPKQLIVISSQGSGKAGDPQKTQQAIDVLKKRGWTSKVIAVQDPARSQSHPMNWADLDIANMGIQAQPIGGYSFLQGSLTNILNDLCSVVVPVTQAPTIPNQTFKPNPPLSTGLCANCEGADGRDRDPVYCDRYYDCRTGEKPTPRHCPAGTFFDDWRGCNHINKTSCSQAPCGASQDEGSLYPSGVCCNKYFRCSGGYLREELCQINEVFDESTSRCVVSQDPVRVCGINNRFYCDINRGGPISESPCPGHFKPDPTGDPCVFYMANTKVVVPMGTYWNSKVCRLAHLPRSFQVCAEYTSDRAGTGLPIGPELADQCSAVFRTQFDRGSQVVINDRIGRAIDVYSIQQEVQVSNRALVFPTTLDRASAASPFLYWYRFISKEFTQNTAFRLRFQLAADAAIGQDYGILSNSYCVYCPESLSITARRTSGNLIEVTATFVPVEGSAIIARQSIDVRNTDMVEAIIIYGVTDVRGQLSTLNPADPEGRPRQSVSFPLTPKAQGVLIMSNKCGLQLGRSVANNFVGTIHEFAFYESCQDIDQILRK